MPFETEEWSYEVGEVIIDWKPNRFIYKSTINLDNVYNSVISLPIYSSSLSISIDYSNELLLQDGLRLLLENGYYLQLED